MNILLHARSKWKFFLFSTQVHSGWWREVSERCARLDSTREEYSGCELWRYPGVQPTACNHHTRGILQVGLHLRTQQFSSLENYFHKFVPLCWYWQLNLFSVVNMSCYVYFYGCWSIMKTCLCLFVSECILISVELSGTLRVITPRFHPTKSSTLPLKIYPPDTSESSLSSLFVNVFCFLHDCICEINTSVFSFLS